MSIPDDLLKPPTDMTDAELGSVIGGQMDRLTRDLARGFDAVFGTLRVCKKCGMTVDPMLHWHDDYRPDTSAHDDLMREAGEYQDKERKNRL